jgi:LCP family protein required for cell wall assembly
MTQVAVYDEDGGSLGTMEAQICTQHGFGDGKKLSCTRTVDAVEQLFYNIPISGYVAINMGAVPTLNDSIGGVRVKVLQDLSYPESGVELQEGEVVTLNGSEAYAYLRGRDINDFDSATDRLRREEQYIINYMNQLKAYAAGDSEQVVRIYDSVEDYLVSNVDFATLAEELLDYNFSEDIMYTVPGETRMGDEFEEYYVDEDEFYDLIIQIFYSEIEEP